MKLSRSVLRVMRRPVKISSIIKTKQLVKKEQYKRTMKQNNSRKLIYKLEDLKSGKFRIIKKRKVIM